MQDGKFDPLRQNTSTSTMWNLQKSLKYLHNIMSDQFKTPITQPSGDVDLASSEKIIQTNHTIARTHQSVNQMRPDKPRATGYKNPLAMIT